MSINSSEVLTVRYPITPAEGPEEWKGSMSDFVKTVITNVTIPQ